MRVKLQPSGSLIVCFFDDYTIANKLGLNNMSDTVVSSSASQHLVLTSTLGKGHCYCPHFTNEETEVRRLLVTGPPHTGISWQTQDLSPRLPKFSTYILNHYGTMLHLLNNIADILLKYQKPMVKIITQQPIPKSNQFFHFISSNT